MYRPSSIRFLLSFFASVAVLSNASQASAAVILTAVDLGGSVVISGSGSLDISGLTLDGSGEIGPVINPSEPAVILGGAIAIVDQYSGASRPSGFGSGSGAIASSGSGDVFGVSGNFEGFILVPEGYVAGSLISATSTFAGESFATLGMTPGTYVWSWSGDSVTLNVGTVPIPATVWLFGSALGFLGWMRRKTV